MNSLLSPETLRFVDAHENEDVRRLALGSKTAAGVDLKAALVQIKGRQAAKEKIPSWVAVKGIVFPPHLPLEQCSSEQTARYKASLLCGERLVDLTGGLGVDFAFLSANFEKSVYVEQQEELCRLARINFPLLDLRDAEIVCGNATTFLEGMEKATAVFIDPARRDAGGKKTVGIGDCLPDVKKLSGLLAEKAEQVLVKLSPMLDVSQALADLPRTKELHVVSVDNECKELLLVLDHRTNVEKTVIHCINLKKDSQQQFSFDPRQEAGMGCIYASVPGEYLYEPNSSILKAGAFKSVARAYNVRKLHPNSHLYTSDEFIELFPGRIFKTEELIPFHKKELQNRLRELNRANITVRNFPISVAELRKRLKLKEGGEIYLFATTLENGEKAILRCSKVPG